MLTDREIARYSRHLALDEIGAGGQGKLKSAAVLVVGAGGLGAGVIQYLAAAGVGTIGIVDDDIVSESNLQRQVIYRESDIGKRKAIVASDYLKAMNSFIRITAYTDRLKSANIVKIFKHYDIIIDCTDNFGTRYLINDACFLLKKPMIYGSIHKFQGQVSLFHYSTDENISPPTYRCLYPSQPKPSTVQNCAEIGVLGVLPGIIGTMQANEAIKLITGIGEVLTGKLFIFDALTMKSTLVRFTKNLESDSLMPKTVEDLQIKNYNYDCDLHSKPQVPEISTSELKQILNSGEKVQFIDVRNFDETSAPQELIGQKIPLSELSNSIPTKQISSKTIVYCKSGKRSAESVKYLIENHQFTQVFSLSGGLDAWNLVRE
jgi:sulfur-carrier protein adenylyltransferase/sulfurtransferase